MAEARLYVHAATALGAGGSHALERRVLLTQDPETDLRPLVKQVLGQPLRQGSHFAELAAIGARLCVGQLRVVPPPDTALYFGSGLGQVRKSEILLDQVLPPGTGVVAPFDFINASPNMGAFYAAAALGLGARNLTVAQDELSFERALALAVSDLRHAAAPAALVGGADENFFPRADYLRRLSLRDDEIMGEGSGWLFLDRHPAGARAELLGVESCRADDSWLEAVACRIAAWGDEPLWLLPGFRLSDAERRALRARVPTLAVRPYLGYCGVYPTAAAFGIAQCLETAGAPPGVYVHLNRNAGSDVMLVALRVANA
jgi:hypothetical protein